jgi:uncharacterized Zn-finger protein
MIPENKKLEQQIETLLGEVKELKENQKIMTNKIEKMQQVIDHIESDIYSDEGFDFEIVCPYCENEFVIDANEDKNEVECPECKNVIELDWTGDLYDDEDVQDIAADVQDVEILQTKKMKMTICKKRDYGANTPNSFFIYIL